MNKRKVLYDNTFMIDSQQLPSKGVCYTEFVLKKSNRSIINGEILDSNNNPVEGAVIEVVRVKIATNEAIFMGYTYTDAFGKYAFSIPIYEDSMYNFSAYKPLTI